jgi:hypothetical protein
MRRATGLGIVGSIGDTISDAGGGDVIGFRIGIGCADTLADSGGGGPGRGR